ncbi:fructosamine kinase family protein [Marivirga salinae]|uniref:Fructosamine kinase family protein n=1 Tax=Marivirga salinarum TaxID=3059078 RepID=A0AA51N913_9BACT|nr:fructosamine kinase family protein [Marivirga sp. BDSF4-3]WMN10778.1 fructosamine kinase family protein [Marivirga sp. BDSF4-3]
MLPKSIRVFLNSFHHREISQFSSVGGGSINDAYRYSIEGDEYFIKLNNQVKGIIEKEVDGLKAISRLDCIATPEVIAFEKIDNYEVLVLPFIKGGLKTLKAWDNFGKQLAEMHKKPAPYYGWNNSNFIGSLPQANKPASDFIDFFIEQRIRPQIDLALKQHYFSNDEINQFEMLFKKLNEILPDTKPSLVHGDLWSGNFMIGEKETPYLIDPSVHYNFRETDLAFTHLFGGFDKKFYEAYNQHFPLEPGFQERISLYNIYPLLVHLNLFGKGYYGSVMKNLNLYVR